MSGFKVRLFEPGGFRPAAKMLPAYFPESFFTDYHNEKKVLCQLREIVQQCKSCILAAQFMDVKVVNRTGGRQ